MKTLFATTAMLALSASIGLAQQSSEKPAKKNKVETSKASPSGVVVVIDPKTHQIVPATPEDIQALEKSTPAKNKAALDARSAAGVRSGPRKIYHHTGAVGVALDESFMTSMVATRDASGKMSYECVEGAKDGKHNPAAGVSTGIKAKKAGAEDAR